jgi:hypothetical protein
MIIDEQQNDISKNKADNLKKSLIHYIMNKQIFLKYQ